MAFVDPAERTANISFTQVSCEEMAIPPYKTPVKNKTITYRLDPTAESFLDNIKIRCNAPGANRSFKINPPIACPLCNDAGNPYIQSALKLSDTELMQAYPNCIGNIDGMPFADRGCILNQLLNQYPGGNANLCAQKAEDPAAFNNLPFNCAPGAKCSVLRGVIIKATASWSGQYFLEPCDNRIISGTSIYRTTACNSGSIDIGLSKTFEGDFAPCTANTPGCPKNTPCLAKVCTDARLPNCPECPCAKGQIKCASNYWAVSLDGPSQKWTYIKKSISLGTGTLGQFSDAAKEPRPNFFFTDSPNYSNPKQKPSGGCAPLDGAKSFISSCASDVVSKAQKAVTSAADTAKVDFKKAVPRNACASGLIDIDVSLEFLPEE